MHDALQIQFDEMFWVCETVISVFSYVYDVLHVISNDLDAIASRIGFVQLRI